MLKQSSDGKAVEDIKVDLRLSVMKELEAKWIVSSYDYLRANITIGYNGYKKAGIIDAIQSGLQNQTWRVTRKIPLLIWSTIKLYHFTLHS